VAGPALEPALVSVVIPAFNRERMVIEALDSVRAQNWRPMEALVVDDGSSDGTSAAVESWTAKNASGGLSVRLPAAEPWCVCSP
jgi:glycosyltransferase involved in cell wall biosynthesis